MQEQQIALSKYSVNIDFRKGSSFSTEVSSYSAGGAKDLALTIARGCGFDAPVRKSVATLMEVQA